jgi:hypothetical protein
MFEALNMRRKTKKENCFTAICVKKKLKLPSFERSSE